MIKLRTDMMWLVLVSLFFFFLDFNFIYDCMVCRSLILNFDCCTVCEILCLYVKIQWFVCHHIVCMHLLMFMYLLCNCCTTSNALCCLPKKNQNQPDKTFI
jgi:hypothetical protein